MIDEMWEKEDFLVANGMSELANPIRTYDANPFDYFDGGLDEDIDLDFSDANGRKKPLKRRNAQRPNRRVSTPTRRVSSQGQARRVSTPTRRVSTPTRRVSNTPQPKRVASTRKNLSSGKFDPNYKYKNINRTKQINADIEAKTLAQLPNVNVPVEIKTNKMNETLKNGLFLGGTAIAVVLGYVLYKKMKK